MACIIHHEFNDMITIFFLFHCIVSIFLGICAILYIKKCSFRKSACPCGQVQTKMYLPEIPVIINSLVSASGQVLMSVPDNPS